MYCPEASGTILSPSDINSQYSDRYNGWTMSTNFDSKIGIFRLTARDGVNHLDFHSYSENNLWFHYLDQDLHSSSHYVIVPGEQTKISTKIVLELPPGYHEQLYVRSGHAAKHRLQVEAGTIDLDYRGEVFVLLFNNSDK